MVAATAMGVVHFILDYRSVGGLCLLVGMLTFLPITPRRFRLWLAPLMMAAAVGAVLWIYGQTQGEGARATRSDVERSAMITAAFQEHSRAIAVDQAWLLVQQLRRL